MIKKEIRKAKQRHDWETVQKLNNIMKTELEMRQIQANIKKINHDIKMSQKGFITTAVGVVVTTLGLAVNALINALIKK